MAGDFDRWLATETAAALKHDTPREATDAEMTECGDQGWLKGAATWVPGMADEED